MSLENISSATVDYSVCVWFFFYIFFPFFWKHGSQIRQRENSLGWMEAGWIVLFICKRTSQPVAHELPVLMSLWQKYLQVCQTSESFYLVFLNPGLRSQAAVWPWFIFLLFASPHPLQNFHSLVFLSFFLFYRWGVIKPQIKLYLCHPIFSSDQCKTKYEKQKAALTAKWGNICWIEQMFPLLKFAGGCESYKLNTQPLMLVQHVKLASCNDTTFSTMDSSPRQTNNREQLSEKGAWLSANSLGGTFYFTFSWNFTLCAFLWLISVLLFSNWLKWENDNRNRF